MPGKARVPVDPWVGRRFPPSPAPIDDLRDAVHGKDRYDAVRGRPVGLGRIDLYG